MKRKFSFNLAPVKTGTKSDDRQTPEPAPARVPAHPHPDAKSQSSSSSPSHRRELSQDSVCDSSAYIDRRVLDTTTEVQLRAACELILRNFKPSDHDMDDTDPKLDFGGLQRGRRDRRKDSNDDRELFKVRMPTGAPVDLKTALEARGLKQTELTLGPARANSSRKRSDSTNKPKPDFAWLDDRDEKREDKLRRSLSQRRRSRQIDPATLADAEAAEWMRSERDKVGTEARPSTARPPSRARSIRDNIRDYVFPGTNSRPLSRKASVESLQTPTSPDPPASAGGRRGWSLRRGGSSRSTSRPSTSRAQHPDAEQPKQADKSAVNLNRELPPLPGLDSWKDNPEPAPAPAPAHSPVAPIHIANLMMRPQEVSVPDRTAAKPRSHRSHRRSGSDTLAAQFNSTHTARSPAHAMRQQDAVSRSKTLTPDSLHALEGITIAGSASTSHLGHAHHRSNSSTSPKRSSDMLSFSRNMSVDTPSRTTYTKEVKAVKREEQKSRLKKVFSGWLGRKNKKQDNRDWMHNIENQGVKEGAMVQEGSAGAPVVRY